MKALTLWPEWAWAICHLEKNVENRSRRTLMPIGTDFAIHAGASFGGKNRSSFSIDLAMQDVVPMAARAGWRVGVSVAQNRITAYRTDSTNTVDCSGFDIHMGAVVAVVQFDGILEPQNVYHRHDADKWPWWSGEHCGYRLSNVRVLDEPVEARGQLGFWNLSEDAEAEILKQI